MINYKLLTPGPLTTSKTVKEEMMVDHCTWDNDYKQITQKIRAELLDLAHVSPDEYTCVLMQGSGTFGVESAITSSVGRDGKLLILSNGAYGERQEDICRHAGIKYHIQHFHYNEIPDEKTGEMILREDPEITHVSMVHSETTSGVPGFSFIIVKLSELEKCKGKAVSLSLDLYDQWKGMYDGKWRFTSPTHVVLAFAKAIEEMKEEGGIPARNKRYTDNNQLLIAEMEKLGYKTYIDKKHQGPIITTFFYPENCNYTFREMYEYIKARGYAIYPGKVTEAETFRIGNIGEIYKEDIEKLIGIYKSFLSSR